MQCLFFGTVQTLISLPHNLYPQRKTYMNLNRVISLCKGCLWCPERVACWFLRVWVEYTLRDCTSNKAEKWEEKAKERKSRKFQCFEDGKVNVWKKGSKERSREWSVCVNDGWKDWISLYRICHCLYLFSACLHLLILWYICELNVCVNFCHWFKSNFVASSKIQGTDMVFVSVWLCAQTGISQISFLLQFCVFNVSTAWYYDWCGQALQLFSGKMLVCQEVIFI